MDRTAKLSLLFFESVESRPDRIQKAASSTSYLWIGLQGRSTGIVAYREDEEFEIRSLIKLNACQPWMINQQKFKRLSIAQGERILECLSAEGIDIGVFLQ